MKRKLGPTDIIFPVPAALVASGTLRSPSLLTVSWIGMMGSDPPILAISLKKSRYSLDVIRKEKEFTVNIPAAKHFREADYCGLVSGRKRLKFQDCGFTAAPAFVVKAPLVEECPFNLECKLVQEIQFGDWVVLFSEVVETHVDADCLEPETEKINVSRLDPLVYCATIREYWNLGERLGFGFAAGNRVVANAEEKSGENTPLGRSTTRPAMASRLPIRIRRAELADAPAIADIYNEAILTTTATFDTEPKSVEERTQWLQSHDERHPVLVAIVDGQVVGWASLTRWSERKAYDDTGETSFYVRSTYRGRGIGRKLNDAIIEEARRLRFHTLIARVAVGSHESIHLNESAGFVHVGTLKEVGRKFDRLLGVHIMQKMLD